MKDVLRSVDSVRLSWAQHVLSEAGIENQIFDSYASIADGSIGAIPRRLMVHAKDYERAVQILRQAEEALENRDEDEDDIEDVFDDSFDEDGGDFGDGGFD
jgi:hypothetical protein